MNDIAIIFKDSVLYTHSVIMVLAVAATVLCAAGLRTIQRPDGLRPFFILIAAAIPAALIMSRLVYGIFVLESLAGIPGILFSGSGGNSLLGAALGVLIVVLVSKPLGLTDSVPELLDCIAPAAALGICVGRLSAVFGTDDRGFDIPEGEAQGYLTAVDGQSGQPLLAVYAYESIFAALLFAALLCVFLMKYKSERPPLDILCGDTALLFLTGFGGSQGVLESMRTDSMTVIGLGFVRVLQIAALLCLLAPLVVFSIRAVRTHGVGGVNLLYWTAAAGALALAVYMEFTLSADFQVQKYNYSVMANCLILVQAITLCLYVVSAAKQSSSRAGYRTGEAAQPAPARSRQNNYPPARRGERKGQSGSSYWDD